MTDSNETVVAECWKAMNALDFDKAVSYYADNAVHVDHAVNLRMDGKQAIQDFWNAWLPEVINDDYFFDIHKTTVTENRFFVEWTWYARFNNSFMGMEAGKKFAVPGASMGDLENGQIVFWQDYYCASTMLGQVGMKELPEELLALIPPVGSPGA
jgi:steroid delta-isomerase-like uncharacterized protein